MNNIEKTVCELAENLFLKGELLEFKKFNFCAKNLPNVKIAPECHQQSSRTIPHQVISVHIVERISTQENTIIYVVEVLACVSHRFFTHQDGLMIEIGGNRDIEINDRVYSYERPFTFTIEHKFNNFTLLSVEF